jgi:hypothetical protein
LSIIVWGLIFIITVVLRLWKRCRSALGSATLWVTARLHARCNFKKLHLNMLFSPTPDATFWLMPFPWVPAPKKERKREREERGGKGGEKKGGKKKKVLPA